MIAQVFDPTQLNIVSARVVLGAFACVLFSDFRVRFLDIRFSYIFVVESHYPMTMNLNHF